MNPQETPPRLWWAASNTSNPHHTGYRHATPGLGRRRSGGALAGGRGRRRLVFQNRTRSRERQNPQTVPAPRHSASCSKRVGRRLARKFNSFRFVTCWQKQISASRSSIGCRLNAGLLFVFCRPLNWWCGIAGQIQEPVMHHSTPHEPAMFSRLPAAGLSGRRGKIRPS